MNLSASLVLYNNDPKIVRQTITPTPELSTILGDIFNASNVQYVYNNGNNVGFGRGHNIALKKTKEYDYHLVINPDIYFDADTIEPMIKYLENNKDVGLINPKICFPNGEIQYLCKRYPTVFIFFGRRFLPKFIQKIFKSYFDWYEMKDIGYDKVFDVPYLSGCFMLFNRKHLDEIGYFDENIFMYLEDADITLRMSEKYRAIFYPYVSVYHYWARGSHNSLKLTFVTIKSAIYLFNKHGWKFF